MVLSDKNYVKPMIYANESSKQLPCNLNFQNAGVFFYSMHEDK